MGKNFRERRRKLNTFFRKNIRDKLNVTDYVLNKLSGRKIRIINAGDDFCYMQEMILRKAGVDVEVVGADEYYTKCVE